MVMYTTASLKQANKEYYGAEFFIRPHLKKVLRINPWNVPKQLGHSMMQKTDHD